MGGALQQWLVPLLIAWLARTNTSHFGLPYLLCLCQTGYCCGGSCCLRGDEGTWSSCCCRHPCKQWRSLQSPIFCSLSDSRDSKHELQAYSVSCLCHTFLPLLSSDLTPALKQQHSAVTMFSRKSCSIYQSASFIIGK